MHFTGLMQILKQVLYLFVAIISFFLCISVILPISKTHIKFDTKSSTEINAPDMNKISPSFLEIIEGTIFISLAVLIIFLLITPLLAIVLLACQDYCPDYIMPIIEFLHLNIINRLRNFARSYFRAQREGSPVRGDNRVYWIAMGYSSDEEECY